MLFSAAKEGKNSTIYIQQLKKDHHAYQKKHHDIKKTQKPNPFDGHSVFSQLNIGPGFLYFHGIGFSGPRPTGFIPPRNVIYNRTALMEYLIGYKFNSWLKVALSYQNQTGISIAGQLLEVQLADPTYFSLLFRIQEFFNLDINALMCKSYLSPPKPIRLGPIASSPYLALGVGVNWQTYSMGAFNLRLPQISVLYPIHVKAFDNHHSVANACLMVDAGFNTTTVRLSPSFSMNIGCKFNYWGQMRGISAGQVVTLKVKSFYSFSPYLGWIWNFPTTTYVIPKYGRNMRQVKGGQSTNVWHAFFAKNRLLEQNPALVSQVNIGPSFFYFSGIKGNIFPIPFNVYRTSNNATQTAPIKGNFTSPRFPIIEYMTGYQIFPWLSTLLSYQYLNPTPIHTQNIPTLGIRRTSLQEISILSYFSINALMFKVHFELPYSLILKNIASTPYLAVGVGPSWQSWTSTQLVRKDVSSPTATPAKLTLLPIKNKNMANVSWLLDAGIKLKNATPNFLFSIFLGCKYNQWGQVRNIGEASQQDNFGKGLYRPLRAKIMYSFTPYIAMQWNFPVTHFIYTRQMPAIRLRYASKIEKPSNVFADINIGPGFLKFKGVRGNLTIYPRDIEAPYTGTSTDLTNLSYNVAPLFEYMLGFRFLHIFKTALVFLYQPPMTVSSKVFQGPIVNDLILPNVQPYTQMQAQLALNAFLKKFYLELPWVFLVKNWATSAYGAIALGVGWQSWTNINIFRALRNSEISDGYLNTTDSIKQVIPHNFVYLWDVGIRLRNHSLSESFSLNIGCRFVHWGKMKNLGKYGNQYTNSPAGIVTPVSVDLIRSTSPYIGLQWDF